MLGIGIAASGSQLYVEIIYRSLIQTTVQIPRRNFNDRHLIFLLFFGQMTEYDDRQPILRICLC